MSGTREHQSGSTTIVARAAKRLSWVVVIGIAAVLAAVSAILLWVVERNWPQTLVLAQGMGHIVITIAVVLIVRKLEEPIIAEDRMALLKEIESKYNDLLESLPLLASATAIGLTRVYPSRADATGAIDEAIKQCNGRLLMIGVAFFEGFSIERSCDGIADTIDRRGEGKVGPVTMDARFLLLNPYTTPAVIRSLMESIPSEAQQYLHGGGKDFLASTLYGDWRRAFKSLNNDVFRRCVKFYRRDPGLWMVMTGRKVFFEPYTLGRPPQAEGRHLFGRRLGGHMPVFEFDIDSPVAKILEDHFNRLWVISQDDMTTLEPLYEDNDAAARQLDKHVFEIRRGVLESLVELLSRNDTQH